MIIRILQPPTRNWLLIAENLNDPETWTRFVPCHTADSERFQFDSTVRKIAGTQVKIVPAKDLLVRGRSVFEYGWDIDENAVLAHAMDVADSLGLDVQISDASDDPIAKPRNVA